MRYTMVVKFSWFSKCKFKSTAGHQGIFAQNNLAVVVVIVFALIFRCVMEERVILIVSVYRVRD